MDPHPRGIAPLTVEVLARGLTGGGPPRTSVPDSLKETGHTYRLFLLLDRLQAMFGGQITVYLVEPFSLTWIARIIRHRPRRYPAFILDGREVIAGLDEGVVLSRVEGLLGAGKESGRDKWG